MNNLLSYCELVDAKIRASDKDLPVFVIVILKMTTLFERNEDHVTGFLK